MGCAGWLACCVALGACVRSDLVPCDNGLACPVGLVCDEVHRSCVTPDQIAACAGVEDLQLCEAGVCRDGVCLAVGCGNGFVDPGEACDDGNIASADGCTADCRSNERCGNGLVDPVNREQCDDGGFLDHDGCTSQCIREEPEWTALSQVPHPQLNFAAYAFDEDRRRFVVFGGIDAANERSGATYEWDGVQSGWQRREPVVAPTPRHGAAMVFHRALGVIVLFGGADPASTVGDTWTWDGVQWKQVVTATSPPRRIYHSMVYDARRGRVVVFGGRSASTEPLADTWAFDGATWTELTGAVAPPGRERAAMGYDPVRDQIVLAGGQELGVRADTWVFDGTTWSPAQGLPSSKSSATLTFDPIRKALVHIGGASSLNPTLSWDGASWQVINSTSPLAGRASPVAFFDPERGGIVAGLGLVTPTLPADLHLLSGATWTALAAEVGPPLLVNPTMTYDARRGTIVLFGGNDGTRDLDITWELTRGTWAQRVLAVRPPARDQAAMAYDPVRGRTVLWGGNATDTRIWEWDGTAWTAITATGPEPLLRVSHRMVFDEVTGQILMMGGIPIGGTTRLPDAWLWNGTGWTQLPDPAPTPRSVFGLAYDRVRREVVLFGGTGEGGVRLGDTWTWTLAGGWMPRQPLSAPSPRSRLTMTEDPVRRRIVLYGGALSSTTPLNETWTWDGSTWERLFTVVSTPPHLDTVSAYNAIDGKLIVVGPRGTYSLQWTAGVASDTCAVPADRDHDGLAGCADTDCWASCAPLCPIGLSCAGPRCGDGACDPVETCRLCPADCGMCPVLCGDGVCDAAEVCPGDCP